jgi:hypothetical protein
MVDDGGVGCFDGFGGLVLSGEGGMQGGFAMSLQFPPNFDFYG